MYLRLILKHARVVLHRPTPCDHGYGALTMCNRPTYSQIISRKHKFVWSMWVELMIAPYWAHDVVATLNQRLWRWFNVATTSCAQQGWGRLQLLITIMITCHLYLSITIMIMIIRHYNYQLRLWLWLHVIKNYRLRLWLHSIFSITIMIMITIVISRDYSHDYEWVKLS